MSVLDLDAPLVLDQAAEDTPPDVLPDYPPRLQNLSYSSILDLHACPRKFQLTRMKPDRERTNNPTFAFGHAVGEGIQSILSDDDWNTTLIRMFRAWDIDLYMEDEKKYKGFFYAIQAVQKFIPLRETVFRDYEIAFFTDPNTGQEVPAVELGFRITTPDGFKYRGYVDVVLRHKVTRELLVLELKTTGSRMPDPATFKNSGQALGYSVVLDAVAPGYSEYKVHYLVYSTTQMEYVSFPFTKSYLQRAEWIHSLILDVEMIKMYSREKLFPKHGESCFNFYSECEFYHCCNMSDSSLIPKEMAWKPARPEEKTIHIELTLMDLINAQIDR